MADLEAIIAPKRLGQLPGSPNIEDIAVENRITTRLVSFRNPFILSGLDCPQPPGTYTVRMEEEMLDTVSFIGWRQTGCFILLPQAGGMEHASVDPQELREALVNDGDQGTDPPSAPSVALAKRSRSHSRRESRR